MRRFTVAFAVASLAGAALAGNASAWLGTPGLGSVMPGSGSPTAIQQVGPDGTTTLVWVDENSDLKMVRIAPTGKYGTPATVNPDAANTTVQYPSLAVAKNGSGVIAWQNSTNPASRPLMFRRFNNKGKLAATAKTAVAPSEGEPIMPSVGLATDGVATLVWEASGVTPTKIFAKRFSATDSVLKDFAEIKTLPSGLCTDDTLGCDLPRAVTSPSGVTTVVWREALANGAGVKLRMRRIDGGDTLGTALNVTGAAAANTSFSPLDLQQSSGGSVFFTWSEIRTTIVNVPMPDGNGGFWNMPMPGPAYQKAFVKRFSPSGTASASSQTVYEEVTQGASTDPALTVNASGNGVVTWVDGVGTLAPTVKYKRVSTSGTVSAAPKVADDGLDASAYKANQSAVSLASNGSLTVLWRKGVGEVDSKSFSKSDVSTRGVKVSGTLPDSNSFGPFVSTGRDGTMIATWLNGVDGARRFVSQVNSASPSLAALKFPGKFKRGMRKGQVKITASKYGTAIVTIAKSGRQKFTTRVTRIAVPDGATTLSFDTRGLVKGKYKVTVQLVDLAGLKTTRTATLLVAS